jgi:hypothetical protein
VKEDSGEEGLDEGSWFFCIQRLTVANAGDCPMLIFWRAPRKRRGSVLFLDLCSSCLDLHGVHFPTVRQIENGLRAEMPVIY